MLTEDMLKKAHKQLTSAEGMSPEAKEVVRRFNEERVEKRMIESIFDTFSPKEILKLAGKN